MKNYKYILTCLSLVCFALESFAQDYPNPFKDFDDIVSYYDSSSHQYLYFEIDKKTDGLIFFDPDSERCGAESGMYRGNISIPEYVEYEGKQLPVTGVRAFYWNSFLYSVEIPRTVKDISYSFTDCCDISSVKIADGDIRRIQSSFSSCPELKQIDLPQGLQVIKSSFCDNYFEDIELPESLLNIGWSFQKNNNLKSVDLNHTSVVWGGSFDRSPILKTVIIRNHSDYIYESFNNCQALQRVEIPDNGIRIKDSFNGCPAIKEIVMWHKYLPFNGYLQNSFKDVDFANCTLYVPEGSADMYRADKDGWGRFGKIIDNLPASVESVAAESGTATGIYDLMGRCLQVTDPDELPAGLYIINGRKTAIK